jgi:hypothetical protein
MFIVLVYMYTGSISAEMEEENITLLFAAADKYGMETLKDVCADNSISSNYRNRRKPKTSSKCWSGLIFIRFRRYLKALWRS